MRGVTTLYVMVVKHVMDRRYEATTRSQLLANLPKVPVRLLKVSLSRMNYQSVPVFRDGVGLGGAGHHGALPRPRRGCQTGELFGNGEARRTGAGGRCAVIHQP